ncbi:hypothetical protein BDN70DRAFT_415488 [Pholiota conissans]|uniref:Uncharacterized protein n=1 Tax=Pholiota conissans TaxID=109636 RepID=A0A9P6CN26_9AGAR|nr:hypothetical protein BDN70DRAFT_415488 [Pholiota conissans]
MVQIKTSIALIALAAAVAPVLAAPVQGEAVELQEREPVRLTPPSPPQDGPAQKRELVDDELELEAREPRFGAGHALRFVHGMRHMHHRIAPPSPPQDGPAQKRELVDDDLELEAREPRFGMGRARRFMHGMRHHRHAAAPPSPPQDAPAQKRELVDDDLELMARDLSDDELELLAREPLGLPTVNFKN